MLLHSRDLCLFSQYTQINSNLNLQKFGKNRKRLSSAYHSKSYPRSTMSNALINQQKGRWFKTKNRCLSLVPQLVIPSFLQIPSGLLCPRLLLLCILCFLGLLLQHLQLQPQLSYFVLFLLWG